MASKIIEHIEGVRVDCAGLSYDFRDTWTIISIGQPFIYIVPNFPALSVDLRQIKVERTDREASEGDKFDAFVRCDMKLQRLYPCTVIPQKAFQVPVEVFATSVKTDNLILPAGGVWILWEWEVTDSADQVESDCSDSPEQSDEHCDTESTKATDSDCDDTSLHTVTFKCIGAIRSNDSQDALKRVIDLRDSGVQVPVNVFCEPSNPVDARAIAFRCKLNGKWITIGYVVSEALDAVHSALQDKAICNVQFAWVKYLVTWSRSGPGYYAGVDITIRGRWPRVVTRCASTK